jgi:hypothetical protein
MSILDVHSEKWIAEPNTGCYIWTGAISGSGQQRAVVGLPRIFAAGPKQKLVGVARLVCEEEHGPPPTPKHHAAHATPSGCVGGVCVNPDHIRWATARDNQQDIPADVRVSRAKNATAGMSAEARSERSRRMQASVPDHIKRLKALRMNEARWGKKL